MAGCEEEWRVDRGIEDKEALIVKYSSGEISEMSKVNDQRDRG